MAVISFTRSEPSASVAKIVTWTAIANADTATPFLPVDLDTAVASVQISGTFGGATLTLQQSNDGTNWFTAKTPTGDDVVATVAGMFEISLSGLYIRPSIAGGSSSSINVILVARG
jgi:hypothetical protein